jgi:hypothetical protein
VLHDVAECLTIPFDESPDALDQVANNALTISFYSSIGTKLAVAFQEMSAIVRGDREASCISGLDWHLLGMAKSASCSRGS